MSNLPNIYDLEEDKSARDLTFLFISSGEQDIIKAIQYSFVQNLHGRAVYNLGFGDYDPEADVIIDNINTNNGDAYKVLHTVLSTIPGFFRNYPDAYLMVQGSDGRPEFIKNCRTTCTKNCDEECKNFNRRINIYRHYVNKNYEQLNIDYQFLGGAMQADSSIYLEDYATHKAYDSVLLLKRNV